MIFSILSETQGMNATAVATAVLTLIAGIGVFLIACKLMSSNLESLSSDKLKALFAKTSKNKLIGVGIGTVATAAIQSSGATTVMVIGFVNAGIMSLMQAATIIFGANIGTTITGQIVALGLFGSDMISTTVIFSALAGIGAFIILFAKKDTIHKIGGILAGFGMLFVGLNMMSGAMEDFAALDSVKRFLAAINNPLLLILIGAALTAIIQSSSVMTSLAITMVFTGLIDLNQGIYLTLGSNIGSCVVTLLAGIGSSTNAKRTAIIHLIFNVAGVIVFALVGMIIRLASKGAITFGTLFEKMFPNAPNTQMAMFHTIFNVVSVILILPFTNLL
ncbi:MAG: Na/Pi symporter, partial [Clostridia bacterium]|nr:Na/Pi symporter [Clostridia bacterium]